MSTPVIVRPNGDPLGNNAAMDGICRTINPGQTPMHRLSANEYENSLRALWPELTLELPDIGKDERVGPFAANVVAPVLDLQAELYQSSAEAVSEQVVAQLEEVLECAGALPEQVLDVEGESLVGSVGQASGDAWLLWSNGSLETSFTTPAAGQHIIEVLAWGSQAGADLPRMDVVVDNVVVGAVDVEVTSANPKTYRFEAPLTRGPHTIAVRFLNDFNDPANMADRNLWVDRFSVTSAPLTRVDRACAQAFVEQVAPRALRRPVTDAERAGLMGIYDAILVKYDSQEALRGVIEALLQSPHFLYRVELGEQTEQPISALTSWELASRLSYFYWDAPPDEELWRAAAAGELSSEEGLRAQAVRMVADPRSRSALNRAMLELLSLHDFETFTQAGAQLTPQLREAMLADVEAFVDHVLWEDDGKIATLLTANYTFVSARTAPLYGMEMTKKLDTSADKPVRVELTGEERIGVLTQPALLARHGYGQVPVHRGLFVRETFLCDRPNPPPDELINPPATFPMQSMRSRAEGRLEHKACGACHAGVDPLGLVFDPFDELGRHVDVDAHGTPVHWAGGVAETPSSDAQVNGPTELARVLGGSDDVRACFTQQWVRYALGRNLSQSDDACTIAMLDEVSLSGADSIQEIFIAIPLTDAFRYRRTPIPFK